MMLMELFKSAPPASIQMSSANPYPFVVPVFIICTARSKAIIQNLAEHTPPCGKPTPMDTLPSYPVIFVMRFLCVK